MDKNLLPICELGHMSHHILHALKFFMAFKRAGLNNEAHIVTAIDKPLIESFTLKFYNVLYCKTSNDRLKNKEISLEQLTVKRELKALMPDENILYQIRNRYLAHRDMDWVDGEVRKKRSPSPDEIDAEFTRFMTIENFESLAEKIYFLIKTFGNLEKLETYENGIQNGIDLFWKRYSEGCKALAKSATSTPCQHQGLESS